MTPLRVAQAIVAQGDVRFLGKTAQAADSALLAGQTLAQVIASAQAGNSATATKLATPRAIAISGDGTGTANFDGSAGITIAMTLANSGVSAGQYTKVTVDVKGRVTSGTTLAAADIPSLDTSKLTSGSLPVARGGTGGTDQATARSGLGIGSMATRNVTISTAAPSGGTDGDIWLQYS
jgi:phage-related tail fiber protein